MKNNKPLIKICGVQTLRCAYKIAALGADFIGIIFCENSRRCVSSVAQACVIASAIRAAGATPVAVFTDADANSMIDICQQVDINTVQLHGEVARRTHQMLPAFMHRIYVLPVNENGFLVEDMQRDLSILDKQRDFLLFDAVQAGGGMRIALEPVQTFMRHVPDFRFFIAGGLQPSNVNSVISQCQPNGVDVASGVEDRHGEKDSKLIEKFVSAVSAVGV